MDRTDHVWNRGPLYEDFLCNQSNIGWNRAHRNSYRHVCRCMLRGLFRSEPGRSIRCSAERKLRWGQSAWQHHASREQRASYRSDSELKTFELTAFSGQDLAVPFDAQQNGNSGGANQPGSITPAENNALVIGSAGSNTAVAPSTPGMRSEEHT